MYLLNVALSSLRGCQFVRSVCLLSYRFSYNPLQSYIFVTALISLIILLLLNMVTQQSSFQKLSTKPARPRWTITITKTIKVNVTLLLHFYYSACYYVLNRAYLSNTLSCQQLSLLQIIIYLKLPLLNCNCCISKTRLPLLVKNLLLLLISYLLELMVVTFIKSLLQSNFLLKWYYCSKLRAFDIHAPA